MTALTISGVAKLASGKATSFSCGQNAVSVVINLNSSEGVVGSLSVQFDESGKPFIRLRREQGIDIVVSGFTQFRLSDFAANRNEARL